MTYDDDPANGKNAYELVAKINWDNSFFTEAI